MGTALTFNIPAMIAYQGSARADHIALIEGRDRVSYGALERLVCQWAGGFAAMGLRPGDRIGLCLTDNAEHVIAILAAMRAGLPFLSMDWKAARREVERRAAQFDLKLVLCHNGRNLPSSQGVLCDEAWRTAVARAPESFDMPRIGPETPALLAASSGSTGHPSVVQVSHAALLARTVCGSWLPHAPDMVDVVLRALPMANTLGRGFNFSYFCSGCTSVLLPSLYGPDEYLEAIERHGITHANANPTILRWLVERAPEGEPLLPGLKVLICTGSTLSPELKREVLERVTPNLFEKYGTVATGVMTSTRPEDTLRRPASVGRPEFGVALEAVDEDDRVVPVGTVGQLRCMSPQAAAPLPGQEEVSGWRAGYWYCDDRGCFDEDGYLTLSGRSSNLIVRASVNIYAEELEEVMRTHPQVVDVAVVGRPAAEVGEEPVALVVVREPSAFNKKELMAHCRHRLAGNKSPAEIFVVHELPRALAGKIKRSALPGLLRLVTKRQGAGGAERETA